MADDQHTILLVEDDAATRTFLADNLTADGYDMLVAGSAREALRLLETKYPDLTVLDLGLPDQDGLEVLRTLRAADGVACRADPDCPVIVLTGRGAELDRIRGFERGADDYVVKPFSYGELRGRLEAVLRRTNQRSRRGRLRVGDLELDPVSRDVRIRGQRVDLSQKEFALLRTLASDPARVFTKAELLRQIWGFRSAGSTRTLDSHACRLRQKLGVAGGRMVINVWGVGYRLVDAPATAVQAAAPAGGTDGAVAA